MYYSIYPNENLYQHSNALLTMHQFDDVCDIENLDAPVALR